MPLPSTMLTATHHDLDLTVVAGVWPGDLEGEMFVSAPVPNPDLSYALFGFGCITRLSLRPGTHGAAPEKFAWRTRTIESPTKRLFDVTPHAFASGPLGFSSALGAPNMVNTAPLPWGDRLFATWDVGRPAELDAVSLDYLAEVGTKASWGGPTFPADEVLPFIFSSAHPVIDPDRDCMWTVKLEPASFDPFAWGLSVVRYDGDGTAVRRWPVDGARLSGSMHTITQTRDWLVLADSGNFKADPGEMLNGERTVRIDDAVAVFLVRKETLDSTPNGTPVAMQQMTLAPTTGHYYARYDDRDGIHVLFEHMDLMDLGYRIQSDDLDAHGRPIDPALIGMYNMAMAPSTVTEAQLDPTTGALETVARFCDETTWNQQLSAMDWSTEGLEAPSLHHLVYQGWKSGAVTQRAVSAYRDRVDCNRLPGEDTPATLVSVRRGTLTPTSRYEFPALDDLPTSPIFAPRAPGAQPTHSRYAGADPGGHDGYVVCPVLNDDGFRIDVFDAADVGRGPVATLGAAGSTIPVLLHAAWAPAARVAPDRERLRFAEDIGPDDLGPLDDELRSAVAEVARAV